MRPVVAVFALLLVAAAPSGSLAASLSHPPLAAAPPAPAVRAAGAWAPPVAKGAAAPAPLSRLAAADAPPPGRSAPRALHSPSTTREPLTVGATLPGPAAAPARSAHSSRAQPRPSRPAAQRFEPTQLPSGARSLRADSLEVIFWPGDEAMAERTLRAAARPLRLPGIPDRDAPPSARILLAPTPAAFDSLTRGAPHWSAGIAVPAERVIVLPAYGSARTPTGDPLVALRHELVHLALNGHLDGRVPRWFDEGYATWASGEWDEGSGWRIRLALAGGGAPPLDSLRLGWPGAEADARLAYLLSASAVRFLAARAGEDAFAAFLEEWRRAGGFDPALRRVYGMTPTQFEEQWRGMVKRRYGWLLAVSQVGIFWGVVAVLLVLLTIPRRRRNRERLARLRDEDWREDAVAQAPEWAEELAEEGEGRVDPEARRG